MCELHLNRAVFKRGQSGATAAVQVQAREWGWKPGKSNMGDEGMREDSLIQRQRETVAKGRLCYCTLLYCASLTVCYFRNWRILATLETLPQSSLSAPFFQHHFFAVCLYVTFGNARNSSSFVIIIIIVLVICISNLWCYHYIKRSHWRLGGWLAFFFLAIKYF